MIFKTTTSNSISVQMRNEKSRWDVTLLTVGFNLRLIDAAHSLQVPQGRHLGKMIVSSLRAAVHKAHKST